MNVRNKLEWVPGRPFELSLKFVDEARSLHLSGAPERCFTRVGPALPTNIRLC